MFDLAAEQPKNGYLIVLRGVRRFTSRFVDTWPEPQAQAFAQRRRRKEFAGAAQQPINESSLVFELFAAYLDSIFWSPGRSPRPRPPPSAAGGRNSTAPPSVRASHAAA